MATNRRRYTAEFKAKFVLEALSGEKTPSEVCRTHKLNLNVLSRWRKEFVEQAPSIFERDAQNNQEQLLQSEDGCPLRRNFRSLRHYNRSLERYDELSR